MKQNAIIIGIIAIIVLVAGAFFYWRGQQDAVVYKFYQDDGNKVGFDKPEAWFAGSTDGYVRVSEDTKDPSKPSILVKIDYPVSIIADLGLDKGEQVMIGDKAMRRVDSEANVPAIGNKPAFTVTYTHLLWQAPDGRKIIFEISPWQKPKFDPGVERFLTSFKSSL